MSEGLVTCCECGELTRPSALCSRCGMEPVRQTTVAPQPEAVTTVTSALAPCPHCGAAPVFREYRDGTVVYECRGPDPDPDPWWRSEDGTHPISSGLYHSEAEARGAWNFIAGRIAARLALRRARDQLPTCPRCGERVREGVTEDRAYLWCGNRCSESVGMGVDAPTRDEAIAAWEEKYR